MEAAIDYQKLVEKFGGQRIARQICQIFLEESPALLREYRDLTIEPGNLEAMAALAHRLKGSLGMIEPSLSQLANSLERACRQGNTERARGLYHKLYRGLERLLQDLEDFVEQDV